MSGTAQHISGTAHYIEHIRHTEHTAHAAHLEYIDVGDDVEGQRVCEDLVRRHLARGDVLLSLVQELVHAGGARAGGSLFS